MSACYPPPADLSVLFTSLVEQLGWPLRLTTAPPPGLRAQASLLEGVGALSTRWRLWAARGIAVRVRGARAGDGSGPGAAQAKGDGGQSLKNNALEEGGRYNPLDLQPHRPYL